MDSPAPKNLTYQTGFGNEAMSEALPGALPKKLNSPQRAPMGLYAEQLNGTAFTAPRSENRRSWLYRIRPSVLHGAFSQIGNGLWRGSPFDEVPPTPNQLRWSPPPPPAPDTDFIDGLATLAGGGDASVGAGLAVHIYSANASMEDRYFYNADGEMLFVPQSGSLILTTEMGIMNVAPGEIAVIQRGIKFSVGLADGQAMGYVCENYGALLRLPSLGPIGANGLANPRDFLSPVAAYEEQERPCRLTCKFGGNLWEAELDHSPLDVVAWHGNYVPYKYDLANFNTIGTVSFDHPDPSIFTVLTSPTDTAGWANLDFVIFPPRWMVGEDTFRPPYFHRNVMGKFMGLVRGAYDAKTDGFVPGGASLHNCMSAHSPDREVFEAASSARLQPQYQGDTLAFMFESYSLFHPTQHALQCPQLQADYLQCWQGLEKGFPGPGS